MHCITTGVNEVRPGLVVVRECTPIGSVITHVTRVVQNLHLHILIL